MSTAPVPGPPRPGVPGGYRPAPPPVARPADHRDPGATDGSGHPAVDAALQAIANAADLPPADQIAQYEAAHNTLQETLATIDQA
ncbi:hypothetical protein [Micromonospora sp. NBC_01796]|uniref:hypothetical protein n=1 Tax=Micromonospora sp. NBC_01796 TaxID=2975987 RepID=UPI002DD8487E|nr:hypothetical protein [Micromonospora sp. NBC_01796]WSA86048.1 hypothetical protein OIE47_37890 [Micromonospora sp. NBC_01796]